MSQLTTIIVQQPIRYEARDGINQNRLFQASIVEGGWDYEATDETGHVYRRLSHTTQDIVIAAMVDFLSGKDNVHGHTV